MTIQIEARAFIDLFHPLAERVRITSWRQTQLAASTNQLEGQQVFNIKK